MCFQCIILSISLFNSSIQKGLKLGFAAYDAILFKITKCLDFGICGEILMIPVALLWMTWPLFIPYYYKGRWLAYVPSGIVTLIQMFRGYFFTVLLFNSNLFVDMELLKVRQADDFWNPIYVSIIKYIKLVYKLQKN